MMITNGPISTFKPIIINSLGFNELNSLLLMMPGGAFAGTIQVCDSFLDHYLLLQSVAYQYNP